MWLFEEIEEIFDLKLTDREKTLVMMTYTIGKIKKEEQLENNE